jgi:hypothetical protein
MESRLTQSKINLKAKLPELKKTLETVQFIESKKDDSISTHFELADNVFASALVKKPSSVCLWLGVCTLTHTYACNADCVHYRQMSW